jgi:hypothetical protein
MNADILSVDYGKTFVVVGRLNAAGATVAGNTSGSVGTTGSSTTNEPWQITKDTNNNIQEFV